MFIPRIYQNLGEWIKPGKVLLIYGPRQVGKTTLLKHFLANSALVTHLESGEDIRVREIFEIGDFRRILEFVQDYDLVAIDEAQKIPHIGEGLKIISDHAPSVRVIVTGSSSFELAGQVGEPLTGRKTTLTLFPVSQLELKELYNPFELKQHLEQWLVYGSYPEVAAAHTDSERKQLVTEITNSYLLKDILALDKVKNSKIILDLLRLLAFQVGSEVSLSELGRQLGIDYKTVARYLDILEQSFVIINVRGYSRNLRKEITKKSKYFFYDIGIRNAIIANFNPLHLRDDVGKLWENFLVIERLKKQAYTNIYSNNYFWRTWGGQELDWVEERDGKLHGYEFKWSKATVRAPSKWKEYYPESMFTVVTPENYLDFVA